MQTLTTGYRGLSLLVDVNIDRIMYIATIGGAMFLAGYMSTM